MNVLDSGVTFSREQFNMLVIKMNEIIESNVLVAATNIATDTDVSLKEAIGIALDSMDLIRESKRERREIRAVI